MLNRRNFTVALGAVVIAAFAMPAAAKGGPVTNDGFEYTGSEAGWQLVQPGYSSFRGAKERVGAAGTATAAGRLPVGKVLYGGEAATLDGFEYIGGDGGWQLAPHRLAFRDGRFVHTADCDHEIRAAATPTAREIEKMGQAYPG